MYVKVTNGKAEIYTIGQLRKDNSNTSFPRIVSDDTLAQYDVYPADFDPQPTFDVATQKIKQGDFVDRDGIWFQTWQVVELTDEEKQQKYEQEAEQVRVMRNNLLSKCDWTQVADAPVDQVAWAIYRQDLRDITAQTGFPYDVSWPVEPV
jgi:hypothetical protein